MERSSTLTVSSLRDYREHTAELEAYLTGHWLTDMANFSAYIYHAVPHLNWAGFYLFDGAKLRLGPFVGKPACTEIKVGHGVCGTAFAQRKALVVADVDAFPGHIACDSASRSELVLPFLVDGECLGVFDIDSPKLARFHEDDRQGITHWLDALAGRFPEKARQAKPWV